MTKLLRLPREVDIYHVAALRQKWLKSLGEPPSGDEDDTACTPSAVFPVDAARVDEIDAAGIQLLLSLARTLAQQRRRLQIVNASQPLRDACARLGVLSLLNSVKPAEQVS